MARCWQKQYYNNRGNRIQRQTDRQGGDENNNHIPCSSHLDRETNHKDNKIGIKRNCFISWIVIDINNEYNSVW